MDPIFIHGIRPRSGTHFLHDLLCAHPDCAASSVPEDFMLEYVHILQSFVTHLTLRWKEAWQIDPAPLYPLLGEALASFLGQTPGASQRVVAKTPSVWNLDHFFRYFPQAALIILVRDGRAVAESGFRSFGWSIETSIHQWNKAARLIHRFEAQTQAAGQRCLIVRYEDLFSDQRATLECVFAFLGLDAGKYDFATAEQLPIKGSSDLAASQHGLHWNPVAKPADFRPLQRWQHWTRRQHERFNWIAGQSSVQLGYPPRQFPASRAVRLYWRLWNHWRDAAWRASRAATGARRLPGFLYRTVRQRLQHPI